MTIKSFAIGAAGLVGKLALAGVVVGGIHAVAANVNTAATAEAKSTPSHLYHLDTNHDNLVEAIKSRGVSFQINPDACFTEENKDTFGWYWAAQSEMVICQEAKYRANTVASFSAEDLDTIRHEAQHLIQDCMDGELDGRLEAVYNKPLALGKEVLGSEGIEGVREAYSEASDHIQTMEIEAFSVAALNDPAEQTADIKKYCF